MKALFDLSDRVTGGIGAAITEGLLHHGAKVDITGRKLEPLRHTAEELSNFGQCIALQSNLSDGKGSKALAAAFRERESQLDILVNNAGNTWGAPLLDYPDEGWEKVINLNLRGVFNLTRDLLPELQKAGNDDCPARVINIGSVAAFVSNSLSAYAYGTSKSAVHQLTRLLAREFAESHVNVNAIAPGRFPSKMTEYLVQNPEAMAAECEGIPMNRFGKPEEIAALAISLASTAGAYMTGSIISLDGGSSLTGG